MELWAVKALLLLLMTVVTMLFGSLPLLVSRVVLFIMHAWIFFFFFNRKMMYFLLVRRSLLRIREDPVGISNGDLRLYAQSLVQVEVYFSALAFFILCPKLEAFEFIAKDFNFPEIPLSEIIACIGFFLIFLLEEVTVICVGKKNSTDKVENCSIKESRNGAGIERVESALGQPDHPVEKCSTASSDRAVDHISWIRSLTLLTSIMFHSVLEGLSIGIQTKETAVLALFFAVISHKTLIAFSLGLQLVRTHRNSKKFVCFCVFLFSIASPAGISIGIGIETANIDEKLKFLLFMIFSALSVGTFLYITFFEIIMDELKNEQSNLLKVISMMVGCFLIGILLIMTPHSEHWHEDNDPSGNNVTVQFT
ncbi:putative metal cation transporter, zinc (Zn2+)-iron (Fe2+) permease (ZIP) family [Trichinella spiralis]|uniref:putative metal cation transporter, zinc (Zn2+)-iron (Fe2+) permease (ZIP) family n=1 Tax=Trichinella spiralis TaxID=6334 RepID=UPI0001EFCF3F|nr:putative metal cation transporter, zinc (Zn2+)-iron (Fe2+) permease (ZIP) family [Trichinella spiralis]